MKFKVMYEKKNGWTEWVHPLKNYKFACCDCGLVHTLQFRIDDFNQLNFRASRDEKQTKKQRKAMK